MALSKCNLVLTYLKQCFPKALYRKSPQMAPYKHNSIPTNFTPNFPSIALNNIHICLHKNVGRLGRLHSQQESS